MSRKEQIMEMAYDYNIRQEGEQDNEKAAMFGAIWADDHQNWCLCKDEMPKFKGKKPKSYLVALQYNLPDGQTIYVTVPALISNVETQEGIAYTPKDRFYWGPDIYDNAIAWMPYPQYTPSDKE